jgi:molybdopterin-guanine dinucleotide biosynthesis protein A
MGSDKALLPHPDRGTWLERTLRLLGQLEAPITLLSRHDAHATLARQLGRRENLPIEVVLEPPPWEGPLLALTRLMERHPDERLLLAPVDMPWLELGTLRQLLESADIANACGAAAQPDTIHLAHDGVRLQPLLGLYPATARNRNSATAFTARGGRSLLRWLEHQRGTAAIAFDPRQVRNANTQADCPPRSAPG